MTWDGKVVLEAFNNLRAKGIIKGKKLSRLIDDISRYASESYSETMAEAFSDCFINGNSAHEISKEIKRLVDIKLRRQIIMHLAPIWDPYIDREKSTIKKRY